MYFKNMIEGKLLELEGGKFQLLCNDLLEHLGYGLVTNSGGQTGTYKTIVGTPDSYILLDKGKFIFIEYTTQQSGVYNKFEADIKKCFDEGKTKVSTSQIEKIIVMYNSNLSVGEVSQLASLCEEKNVKFEKIDINNITYYLSGKFPFLVKDHLGISIDKGQFLDYKTFIHMNDELMLSTPLGLSIHGRKDNIIEFQDMIDDNEFLVVVGKTGVGKTKFVCEALNRYVYSEKNINIWFIKDRGLGLYEDLLRYTSTGHHLIFLDDINKQTAIDELLAYVRENKNRIKVVATVRDYALESTLDRISKYVIPKTYEIEVLNDEVITGIVKENFGIYNPDYQKQIAKLAKGNVRLAVMMAILVKNENSLESIHNIGEILEKYYEFVKEELEDMKDVSYLKALGALSFIDKLHLNSDDTMEIVSGITELSKDELVQIYKELHFGEVVDLYEDEVVVISDQIVSIFIFHYVYEVRELLDYTAVLESLFPTH